MGNEQGRRVSERGRRVSERGRRASERGRRVSERGRRVSERGRGEGGVLLIYRDNYNSRDAPVPKSQ